MNLIKKKEEIKEKKLQTKKSLSFKATSEMEILLIYFTDLLIILYLLYKLFGFTLLSIYYPLDFQMGTFLFG